MPRRPDYADPPPDQWPIPVIDEHLRIYRRHRRLAIKADDEPRLAEVQRHISRLEAARFRAVLAFMKAL